MLVAPTITDEPFGMIAIEAQSFGIPVIASDSGGFKENIIDGATGFLFKSNNVSELTKKIEEFLINNKLLLKFSAEAIINIKTHFTERIMLEKIKVIIERLL